PRLTLILFQTSLVGISQNRRATLLNSNLS
ncbi:hypothetical protein TrispH2_011189, partial [Trichoplax sp. H2]